LIAKMTIVNGFFQFLADLAMSLSLSISGSDLFR